MKTPFDIDEEEKFAESPVTVPVLEKIEPVVFTQVPELEENIDDYKIDVNSPMARFIRGRTEAKAMEGQPTELQKKYKELGLEYDYRKREETGSVYEDPERQRLAQLEQINPDFTQRHIETDKAVNLRSQLTNQYEQEMGRLNALEMQVWSRPSFAASSEGKATMAVIRRQQQLAQSMFEREDSKLDNQYYDKLPPKDRAIANVLVSKGFTGQDLTYYTVNNGDIRDTVNEYLLSVPDDRKEEFTNRILGDFVRDDQGNIVRNELGEELRKGSDIVQLSPAGTYDFKVTPDAYKRQVKGIFETEYQPQIQDRDATVKDLKGRISNLDTAIQNTTDENLISVFEAQREEFSKQLGMMEAGIQPTKTEMVETEVATTGEPTTEVTEGEAEIGKMEEQLNLVKTELLRSNLVSENADGTLTYTNDLPESDRKVIDDWNKQYEESIVSKSGRSPFLEGTGLASVGRGIGGAVSGITSAVTYPTRKQYEMIGDFLSARGEEASEVLSQFSEAGRKRILEEERKKARRQ
jgi:hypothetical protein